MHRKETNLILAADVQTKAELLSLVESVGPHLCVVKTHIDIIHDFDQNLIFELKKRAEKILIFALGRPQVCRYRRRCNQQYLGGIYRIADWADIITVHTIAGQGTLAALQQRCA